MRSLFAKCMVLCVVTMFLASCATTSLVDSWRNPDITPAKRYHKLLVSSIGRNVNERKVYEDVIVAGLRQQGVDAVASYPLILTDNGDMAKMLDKAVKLSGADAVLSVQTTMIEQKANVVPGYPDFWYPPAYHSWNMGGYYGTRMLYEPPTIIVYSVATLQANLFDVANRKLVWAASLETSEPGKVLAISREVARLVIQSLVKQGLI